MAIRRGGDEFYILHLHLRLSYTYMLPSLYPHKDDKLNRILVRGGFGYPVSSPSSQLIYFLIKKMKFF